MSKSADMHWYALHVRSRHEFVARDELRRKGVEAFLPSARRLRHWKDRTKFVDLPLFPGYLFVQVEPRPNEYLNVLKTRGAVRLLCAEPGRPTPVPREEISSLRLVVESGEELDVHPTLKEGARVRLRRGPLRTAEGVLERREDQYVFIVNIDILGRSVSVRVFADDLEEA